MRLLAVTVLLLVLATTGAGAENLLYCVKAEHAQQAGKHESAINNWTRCINRGGLTPANLAIAHYNRGIAYYNKNRYNQAIRDYTKAIRFDSSDAAAYANRGNAYQRKGQAGRAIQDYDEAIRLDPGDAGSYYNRGLARQALGNDDLAARDYGEAIHLDPSLARTHKNYTGSITQSLGFLANLDFLPGSGSAQSYYDRGDAQRREGNFEKAAASYAEAVQRDPDYAAAYDARAAFERAMAVADTGWVGTYQEALTRHGYYHGAVNGAYDPATRAALQACLEGGCRVIE
jgi:tetratricopeptide (TPR) repeat protein